MFIIKALIPTTDGAPGADYRLFQAEEVRVNRSTQASASSDPKHRVVDPDWEINLCSKAADVFPYQTLLVGDGIDHYSRVFIMNTEGKTIEVVKPLGFICPPSG